MNKNTLSVRELKQDDIEYIVQYWLNADNDFLTSMGVDLAKLPSKASLTTMLLNQLNQAYPEKQSYCIIWEVDQQPVGHSNINKIKFGEEAYMHLHLWNSDLRQKGMGAKLVKMSLPFFFKNCQLKQLHCEPYAYNPAPNKTLQKVGFQFVKKYVTIPGSLNFEQEVNHWVLDAESFKM